MTIWTFILGCLVGGSVALVVVRSRRGLPPPQPLPSPPPPEPSPPPIEPAPSPPSPVSTAHPPGTEDIEAAIGHRFRDIRLLEQALTHRSYVSEHEGAVSYERLEFLGDAVLQLAVTRYLYEAHPELAEGEMAKVRSAVVSEPVLAAFAEDFRIAPALLLGKGEESTGGREKASLLSDVVESVIGALFLETDMEYAREFVIRHWEDAIEERVTAPGRGDYKTRLQEMLARDGRRPEYRLTETGPPHARVFDATVSVGGTVLGTGRGTSKKRAQQAAARAAIGRIA